MVSATATGCAPLTVYGGDGACAGTSISATAADAPAGTVFSNDLFVTDAAGNIFYNGEGTVTVNSSACVVTATNDCTNGGAFTLTVTGAASLPANADGTDCYVPVSGGSALVTILIILLVLAAGAGGFFFYKKKQDAKKDDGAFAKEV